MTGTKLAPWQKVIAKVYGGGDYGYVTTLEQCKDRGDTLFTFLMLETSPTEDCDTADIALQRVDTAINDLQAVRNALADLPNPDSMDVIELMDIVRGLAESGSTDELNDLIERARAYQDNYGEERQS